ncbi:hypothetical protein PGB90_001601 [Kerria lacca]
MVQLHIKKNDESQFLFDISVNTSVDDCYSSIVMIYNGRLKINRICREMDLLKEYGTMYHPNVIGLNEQQIKEMKFVDEWDKNCVPSGEWLYNEDPVRRRNGKQPNEKMRRIITTAVEEAKALISKKQVQAGVFLTQKKIQDTLDMLQGTIMTIYPTNLPPYDVIRQEFENGEDLSGSQDSMDVSSVPPPKEPIMSNEEKKLMMLHAYKRQEELKPRPA